MRSGRLRHQASASVFGTENIMKTYAFVLYSHCCYELCSAMVHNRDLSLVLINVDVKTRPQSTMSALCSILSLITTKHIWAILILLMRRVTYNDTKLMFIFNSVHIFGLSCHRSEYKIRLNTQCSLYCVGMHCTQIIPQKIVQTVPAHSRLCNQRYMRVIIRGTIRTNSHGVINIRWFTRPIHASAGSRTHTLAGS